MKWGEKRREDWQYFPYNVCPVCVHCMTTVQISHNILRGQVCEGLYFWYSCVSRDLLLSLGPGPGPITLSAKQASAIWLLLLEHLTHLAFHITLLKLKLLFWIVSSLIYQLFIHFTQLLVPARSHTHIPADANTSCHTASTAIILNKSNFPCIKRKSVRS